LALVAKANQLKVRASVRLNRSASHSHVVADAVNTVVATSVARLSNVFSQHPPEFDEKTWNGVARAIFETLAEKSDKVVSIVHAKNESTKYVKDVRVNVVEAVARALTKLNILRLVDFEHIAFHRPVYGPAFKILKDKELFKEKF